jgi:hypothetical protein
MSHRESSCQRRKVLRWVALVSTPTSLIQQVANSFVNIKCHRTFVRLAIGLLSDLPSDFCPTRMTQLAVYTLVIYPTSRFLVAVPSAGWS